MSWKPRNKSVDTETPYLYYGTCTSNGKSILVYGDKPEATEDDKKPREPQSRRTINIDTITKMVRGTAGIGTPGIDSLVPIDGGRDVFDITSLADEDCPHREDYLTACETVANEIGDEDEIPDFIADAVAIIAG